jgi:hypothetical protein
MPQNETLAGRADPMAPITLPAERRNALYAQLRTSLLGVD